MAFVADACHASKLPYLAGRIDKGRSPVAASVLRVRTPRKKLCQRKRRVPPRRQMQRMLQKHLKLRRLHRSLRWAGSRAGRLHHVVSLWTPFTFPPHFFKSNTRRFG